MASDSSPNPDSNALSGNDASPETLPLADSRKEDREEARSGVVGRDVRVREVDLARLPSSPAISLVVRMYRCGDNCL